MSTVKNPPMLNTGGGGGGIAVVNGIIEQYKAEGEDLAPNTFVEFVDAQTVRTARDSIDGLTHTACTTTTAGEVYVL